MLLSLLDNVAHYNDKKRKVPIFSIHFHPKEYRFATGGADCQVKIWDASYLKNTESKHQEPFIISALKLHTGAVMTVRWSNEEGKYLASGSDDMVILIWQKMKDSKPTSTFGEQTVNLESWKVMKRIAHHRSDITDLAWSPDNSYLASCSADCHVYIWNGRTFGKLFNNIQPNELLDLVKDISQHTSMVKGVSWDPVGKYLATQAEDQCVKIWSINNWSLEKTITKPFEKTSPTFFCRLSWSPEGSHLATPNAVNGLFPICSLITRSNWTTEISLVGHRRPIITAAFNRMLFQVPSATSGEEPQLAVICALGSEDRSITVWSTLQSKVLAAFKDLFEREILDITWSCCGYTLLACSFDGGVISLTFNENEIGSAISNEQLESMLQQHGYVKQNNPVPENPEFLKQPEKQTSKNSKKNQAENGSEASATVGRPATSKKEPMEQMVTITKEGKKRIQPVLLQSSNEDSEGNMTVENTSLGVSREEPSVRYNAPSSLIPEGGIESLVIGNKRNKDQTPAAAAGTTTNTSDQSKRPKKSTEKRSNETDDMIVTTMTNNLSPLYAVSQVRLATPKVVLHITRKVSEFPSMSVECHNGSKAGDFSKVACSVDGKVKWTDFIPTAALIVTGNRNFIAIALNDGSLIVYNTYGRKILPPLQLEAIASFLECNEQYLLCLTSVGLIYVWDLKSKESIIPAVSVSSILGSALVSDDSLSRTPCIVDVHLRANGVPIVTLSTGFVFAYDLSLKTWLRMADPWMVNASFGQRTEQLLTSDELPQGPVRTCYTLAKNHLHNVGNVKQVIQSILHSDQNNHEVLSLSFAEQQMNAALLLKAPMEYKFWLFAYVKRLAQMRLTERLKELFMNFHGPPEFLLKEQHWDPFILGHEKRILLKEMLSSLADDVNMQRLLVEFELQ